MGNGFRSNLTRRVVCAAAALLIAPTFVLAQSGDDTPRKPLDAMFSDLGRDWLDRQVPDPNAFGRPTDPIVRLLSARSFVAPRHIEVAGAVPVFRPTRRRVRRAESYSETPWIANPFQLQDPTDPNQTVDVRRQMRAYLREQIVTNILSKTPFGRTLSVFIDSKQENRSRMIPFISPQFDAKDGGKVGVSLVWKF